MLMDYTRHKGKIMKYKRICVNNCWFEALPIDFDIDKYRKIINNSQCDIEQAYRKPSKTKKSIWNYWKEWAANCYEEDFYICQLHVVSHNCDFFSIGAVILDDCYELRGFLRITKSHNRMYLLDFEDIEDERE